MADFLDFVVRDSLLNPLTITLLSTDLEQIDEGTRHGIDAQIDDTDPLGRKGAILAESASKETSPLGVLNSNPSPSTLSSEAPTVPVSPAATSQVVFPASLSMNSSGYPTSQASSPASVPTAAAVTSELRPAATSTLAPHAPNQLILKFKQGIASAEVAQFKSLFGAVSTQTIKLTGAEIWKLSGSLSVEKILKQYRSNPIFEYIEPDYIRTLGTISTQATFPNDPSFNQLWGLHNTGQSGGTPDADIDAPEAWDIQKGNPNLVIGVLDTGVDYNHPDLAGNIWTNPGEIAGDGIDNDGNGYVDDIRGWDFAYNDNNPSDVQGHGTHVSGTIAGKGNNGVGVTGVAWNAKIMPLKFLNDQGSGSTSNAILAINYATAKGVKLTNNSWGGGGFSQGLYNAINAAGQAGALFIAAAGNNGNNNDANPFYPASYNLANIISVAATNRNDQLVTFANTGGWWGSNYGLTSVDLGAPGSDIYSLAPGGGYATLSGTSMASPHVAGAAALLWSQNPTWTAQQVKNALMNTGDPLASLAGKTVSGKRLNVFKALGGSFTVTNQFIGDFASWSANPNVRVLTGDFNGDGKTDVSLVNQSAGWNTLPVAFSQGNGNFSVTNQFIGDFASWSANSNVRVLTGDFNGDGKTDVSLVNQSAGWNTLPVAFSQGNGNFSVTNQFIGDFSSWSANSNVRVLTGDFNGDGKTDVSLVNKSVGWNTLPVAFSQGNGNFSVTNQFTGDFASWAANPNVDALTGDFNGDGKTDVALINKTAGWNTLPVAFSQGNGSFSVTNQFIGDFASWAANPNVRVRTGDFNGDGKTDVSLVNQSAGWNTLPVAFSQGNGNFSVTNQFIGDFASWAANPNVNVLTGNFNGDSKTDVALVNQSAGWNTLPVAFF